MSKNEINELIKHYSAEFDYAKKETAIILAAGHGKRIKSQTSKMLHKIWESPTVERVCNACLNSLQNANVIIVVGIKADEVIRTVGKKNSVIYAYQEEQKGTGHAVQIALEKIDSSKYDGTVYVFPGDMGLIDGATINCFRNSFIQSKSDMIVLTGIFEGPIEDNYYGRIVRVPVNKNKNEIADKNGNLIEIIEYKDIMNLSNTRPYKVKYKKKEITFKKKALVENREFNSGVFAFKYQPLNQLIEMIGENNIQKEIYLTDLVYLFNRNGYAVSAISPKEQYVLMGFNNKSVLKEMDAMARKLIYDKLKDIIEIDDPDDFFIDESVVNDMMESDNKGIPLDIRIGKGVYIGKGVKLNFNISIMKNVFINGAINFGKNIVIRENTQISCFYGQKIEIGDNTEIFGGNIIKGNVKIGKHSMIESGVRITGSDDYPVIIGDNVTIKGITYIFGSLIEDHIHLEHSVIIRKNVTKPRNSKQDIYKVRYYLPEAEGIDAIKNL
jgi:bifunctional UDP-N-acetylglucosamine pyrophosphorylase/glucosamine-1-phosphate N-acetyltransferase